MNDNIFGRQPRYPRQLGEIKALYASPQMLEALDEAYECGKKVALSRVADNKFKVDTDEREVEQLSDSIKIQRAMELLNSVEALPNIAVVELCYVIENKRSTT
jgi:hypothetical protein